MSASEYLPLYQSFTNRTYIKKWHWFDQSKIAQIIDANKCCLKMYGRYVNSSIAYILVSVCPADGITSYCPIWVDTIKKRISIKIWRAFVQYKGVHVVYILSWRNFELPKGSRIPRPPCNMTQNCTTINERWISITLHRLQHMISRFADLLSSTSFKMNGVETKSRRKNTPLLDIE